MHAVIQGASSVPPFFLVSKGTRSISPYFFPIYNFPQICFPGGVNPRLNPVPNHTMCLFWGISQKETTPHENKGNMITELLGNNSALIEVPNTINWTFLHNYSYTGSARLKQQLNRAQRSPLSAFQTHPYIYLLTDITNSNYVTEYLTTN